MKLAATIWGMRPLLQPLTNKTKETQHEMSGLRSSSTYSSSFKNLNKMWEKAIEQASFSPAAWDAEKCLHG